MWLVQVFVRAGVHPGVPACDAALLLFHFHAWCLKDGDPSSTK